MAEALAVIVRKLISFVGGNTTSLVPLGVARRRSLRLPCCARAVVPVAGYSKVAILLPQRPRAQSMGRR